MKKLLFLFILTVALLFGVTFSIQNRDLVNLSYYFGLDLEWPLSLIVIATFFVGIVTGVIVCKLTSFKKRIAANGKAGKTARKI